MAASAEERGGKQEKENKLHLFNRVLLGAHIYRTSVLIGRLLPPPTRRRTGRRPGVIHRPADVSRGPGRVDVCSRYVAGTIVEESGARDEVWLGPALADLKRSAAIRRWLHQQQQHHHNKVNNNNNESPPDKMPMLLQHPPPPQPLRSLEEPQPLDFSVKQYSIHPRRHNLFLHSSNSETSEDEGGPPPDSPLRGDTTGE